MFGAVVQRGKALGKRRDVRLGGREPLRPEIDGLYDAFRHSRASRVELPLLGPAEARAYVAEVRAKALDALMLSLLLMVLAATAHLLLPWSFLTDISLQVRLLNFWVLLPHCC